MLRNLIKCSVFLFLLVPFRAAAQKDSVIMVKFTPEFEFTDGIFLNFQQVRVNMPIPKSRLLSESIYDDRTFFDYITKAKSISFYDRVGLKQMVRAKDLWGFSRNGVLYIRMGENYHRITIVGQICHFVATVTTYDTRAYDPYYYSPNNYYNYRYGGLPTTTSSSEMRQYLLDFNTGEVRDYTIETLELLLMQDPELHDEYSQLRKKKKKQTKFLFMRKFNEKNPLYIPVTQKFNP